VNGVAESIEVFGEFDLNAHEALDFGAHPLVLVDIEGGESTLVTAEFGAKFKSAIIVVEVHDFSVPGTGKRLKECLSKTHTAEFLLYDQKARVPLRLEGNLSPEVWEMATDEKRPKGNYWLVATPRPHSS